MNNVLFISFDLIRAGEPGMSLSAASLIAYLKQSDTYGDNFTLDHQTIDCNSIGHGNDAFEKVFLSRHLPFYNVIALSCHIWSERYVQHFIKKLRGLKWKGLIVLGGPQMNDNIAALKQRYTAANIFVQGYGEKSLLHLCNNAEKYYGTKQILQIPMPSNIVPSVYSRGILKIEQNQKMVRLETKRNCPYNCSFCHFTDFTSNKVGCLNSNTINQELKFLKEANVGKINIMDPTFNILNYKDTLKSISELRLKSAFSFQTHFNTFKYQDEEVIELFKSIHSHLEFGIQSTNPKTLTAINRKQNWEHITASIKKMIASGISFEISLIYGLPFQSLIDYQSSVKKLRDIGVKNIYGFPLQIYPGTQLTSNKTIFGIKSSPNHLGIEQVISTKWMSKSDIITLNNWGETKTKHT
jgi:radical SAM superfamily enzyme YgiQ (UPF0313 family)